MKGQIISGEFGRICIRQKSNEKIELGELLVADTDEGKILLQVYDLTYGSQISQQNLELMSGLKIEEDNDLELLEPHLRNYNLAFLKPMITITDNFAKLCKELPKFFSEVREVQKEDLKFLTKPQDALFVGKLRSGSKVLDVDINLPGENVLSHHILIPATTGRGKSNLVSVMLWNLIDKDYCGILVLDPHDEYYGRNDLGLKNHPSKQNLSYYTPNNAPPGTKTLKINLKVIKPNHFNGAVHWTDPQQQCLGSYYKEYGQQWIEAIVKERPLNVNYYEGTMSVVRRKLMSILDLKHANGEVYSEGIFDKEAGQTTIKDICDELESGKKVIVDTSSFSGSVEILVGSLIATEIFARYKHHKIGGQLANKPVISVFLEEAPRVLGKEVLEKGSNIFSTIAREGRKFKIGICAITQIPSLIPREILANMNTKIILGIEMAPERQAIIESASQDLSNDNRTIASLDKGEAIITSNFTKFATPIKIPLFKEVAKNHQKQETLKDFSGIQLS